MKRAKEESIHLRKRGATYNEIIKKLHIPKSTLSGWLKNITISENIKKKIWKKAQRKWAENIIAYNHKRASLAKKKWHEIQSRSSQEIRTLSKRDLKILGISLYWAEGCKKTKWTVMFCNSDSQLVALMMRFFREVCIVPENKFRASVQIHKNILEQKAKKHWSKITNLPVNQFLKTIYQVPISSRNKRPISSLPYGTFRLYISDVQLVNKIKGWIEGLALQSKI